MKACREGLTLASRMLHGEMERQTKDWTKPELTGCDEDKIEGGGNICSQGPLIPLLWHLPGTQAQRYINVRHSPGPETL